jgi:2-oxoglutarate dehydrogenase E2 component (dihydrolipoamide succinyltransferase)
VRTAAAVLALGAIAGCAKASPATSVPAAPVVVAPAPAPPAVAPAPPAPPPVVAAVPATLPAPAPAAAPVGTRAKDSPRQLLTRAESLLVAEDYRGANESYAAFLLASPDDGAAARARATRAALDRLLSAQAEIQRLQREAADTQAEVQRLKRDATARDTELTRVKKDLAAQAAEIERLKADLERLKSIDLRPEQRRR